MKLFWRKPNVARLVSKKDVKGLSRALRYDDSVVRSAAGHALVEMHHPDALNALTDAFSAGSPQLRRSLVGSLRYALVYARLPISWRSDLANAVAKVEDMAVLQIFLEAAERCEPNLSLEIRHLASRALEASHLDVLVAALLDDRETTMARQEIALELGRRKTEVGFDALVAAVRNHDSKVASYALIGLSSAAARHSFQPLAELLLDHSAPVYIRSGIPDTLKIIDPVKARDVLVTALQRDADATVKACAGCALAELGDSRAVPGLVTLLQSSVDIQSTKVVKALSLLGDRRATPALLQLFLPLSEYEVADLTAALVRLRDPDAIPVLLDVLQDTTHRLRAHAATILGAIGDHRALGPLLAALRDSDQWLSKSACAALVTLGDRTAVRTLVEVMTDPDVPAETRRAAADALGRIGDPRALDPLISVAGSEDGEVVSAACAALGILGDARALSVLLTLSVSGRTAKEAIQSILTCCSLTDVPLDVLVAISKYEAFETRQVDSGIPDYGSVEVKVAIDCSEIQRISAAEVERRGSAI